MGKDSATLSINGVVDRDYKSQETIASLQLSRVEVLSLHEAESYLCIPSLVVKVTEKLGLVDTLPTTAEVENLIVQTLKSNYLVIAAQRVIQKSNAALSVSVENKILSNIGSREELEERFRTEAAEQANFALSKIGPDAVVATLEEEISAIELVISNRDVTKALELCPGKSLLAEIVKLTGAKSFLDLLRAATTHVAIGSETEIDSLRSKLTALFSVPE